MPNDLPLVWHAHDHGQQFAHLGHAVASLGICGADVGVVYGSSAKRGSIASACLRKPKGSITS